MDFRIVALLVILGTLSLGLEDDEEERIKAEFQMMSYDLADVCTDRTKILKKYYLAPNEYNLDDKMIADVDNGKFLRNQSYDMMQFQEKVPYDLTRNWTFVTKCGDPLLSETQYRTLIWFANKNLHLSSFPISVQCKKGEAEECVYNKRDVERELTTSRDSEHLKNLWSSWQLYSGPNFEGFRPILDLTKEAAEANGHLDVKSYWEMLVDTPEAYKNAEELWNEFEPLYSALHDFVLRRLNKYYSTDFSYIPAYLTGSALGDDWSALAEIVLPHPQLYHDIKVEFNAMDVEHLYKFAENLTKSIGLRSLSKHFWKHSDFTQASCQTQILTYCNEEMVEVLACNRSDLSAYLEAHRTAMRIAIDRLDYIHLPQRNLRSSPVVEAVCEMASLYGMNTLSYHDVLPENVFIKEDGGQANRMTALILTALRVFPKIAYYYAVDMWRLQELEEPSQDIVASWWEFRKRYQQVEGANNTEPDFMADEMILYNKPYISKFLGMFLQFQFLNYHQLYFFRETSNQASTFKEDSSFKEMLQNLISKETLELLSYYYGFNDVSYYPTVEFFSSLTEYLQEASLEQSPVTIKQPKYKKPEETVLTPKTKSKSKVKTKVNITTTPETLVTNDVMGDAVPVTEVVPTTTAKSDESVNSAKTAGNYAAIVIIFATMAAIIGACVWKRARRKRRRNNNRRPDI